MKFLIVLVFLAQQTVFARGSMTSTTPKENILYLKELIRAESWAYDTIKEIIKLDAEVHVLSQKQEDGWQEKLRVIEDHPSYISDAMNSMIDLFEIVAKEELIKEPMLWKVVAPNGYEHYLFGTTHSFIPANFSPEVLATLQAVVRGVDTVMHEGASKQQLETVRHAVDNGKIDHLEIDYYVMSLATQEDKKLSRLEGAWEALLEMSRQEKEIEAIEEQENAKVAKMSEDETIHYIVVDQLEPTFLSHRAYVRRDLLTLQSLYSTDKLRAIAKSGAVEQRNHNWLPRIIANCKESSCLIVAGVRHMLPDSENFSLISLLRQQGFEVQVFDVSLTAR